MPKEQEFARVVPGKNVGYFDVYVGDYHHAVMSFSWEPEEGEAYGRNKAEQFAEKINWAFREDLKYKDAAFNARLKVERSDAAVKALEMGDQIMATIQAWNYSGLPADISNRISEFRALADRIKNNKEKI